MRTKPRTSAMPAGSLVSDPEAIHAAVGMLTKDTRQREMRCLERRCDTRLPFQRPVQVTPLNEHEESINLDGPETMTAYARDISPSGVGLLHDQPINSNRVLLSFELLGGKTLSLVVQLTWCRYLGDFWHSSGGRPVCLVMPPSQNSLEDLEVDELAWS